MNREITIMMGLQRHWNMVLQAQEAIERCGKNIEHWKGLLAERESSLADLNASIRKMKADVRSEELLLAEMDQKIRKLEERRNLLKSGREIEALENELARIRAEDESKAESLISLIDILSEKEKSLPVMQAELDDLGMNVRKSLEKLENDIKTHRETVMQYTEKYDAMLNDLSAAHRGRFDKLLKSRKGKAVGEVRGEVCGLCNFQIPSQLANEASHDSKTATCTNCGAYIYKTE
jgi:predicted  nucleic acid-binding Zn-ribbon protein